MTARATLPSGIELAYEETGEGPPLLLIMGVGAQMLLWPDGFVRMLAGRGFRVIRFDNRDVGESTRLDHLGAVPLTDLLASVAGRRRQRSPYLLSDMADDAFGLLDHLGIEGAHVVGASMGGMIAQTMAIGRPERVSTLTSIMSTTGSRRVGLPLPRALSALLARPDDSEDGAAAFMQNMLAVTGSPAYPSAPADIDALARRCYRRGPTGAGFSRQFMAILSSGDRTAALERLDVPALVIHGTDDPLVHISGGEATAAAIPGALLHRVAGMGHDLPPALWDRFATAIRGLVDRADAGDRAGR